MANRYYNAPLGAKLAQDVAEGAADTSQLVAVRVTYDATGATKENVLLALDAVRQAITEDTYPPA